MRYFGMREVPQTPVLPDTALSLLLTAATGQAFDYPAGTDMIRVSVGSTIAGTANLFFNPASTAAALPTTAGTVTTASSGLNIAIGVAGPVMFQRPRSSTGFSLISGSSVSAHVEFWSRAGTTG